MSDEYYILRVVIRACREQHKQTQQEVADYLGINRASYNQMEKGPRKILALELCALCKLWALPVNETFALCRTPKVSA